MGMLTDLLIAGGNAFMLSMTCTCAKDAGVLNAEIRGNTIYGTFKGRAVVLTKHDPSTLQVAVISSDPLSIETVSDLQSCFGLLVENSKQPASWGLIPTKQDGVYGLMLKETISNSDPTNQIRSALDRLWNQLNTIS